MMTPESGYTTFKQRSDNSMTTAEPKTTGIYATSPASVPKSVEQSAGEELKYLDNELGSLFGAVEMLERRLEAILTPPGPDTDGSGQLPPFASPLVLKLKDQTTLLANANRRLNALINRIEL